jgi:hypothetical protein
MPGTRLTLFPRWLREEFGFAARLSTNEPVPPATGSATYLKRSADPAAMRQDPRQHRASHCRASVRWIRGSRHAVIL